MQDSLASYIGSRLRYHTGSEVTTHEHLACIHDVYGHVATATFRPTYLLVYMCFHVLHDRHVEDASSELLHVQVAAAYCSNGPLQLQDEGSFVLRTTGGGIFKLGNHLITSACSTAGGQTTQA